MKAYVILHKPTGRYFPHLRSGASTFDFNEVRSRIKHQKDDPPPRFFESKRLAGRYITEYCKGWRRHNEDMTPYYSDLGSPRYVDEFAIIEATILFGEAK